MDATVTITIGKGNIARETEKAYGIEFSGTNMVWLPKSLVTIDVKDNISFGTITMPTWLARKNGLLVRPQYARF
jgi:hypothetical protein